MNARMDDGAALSGSLKKRGHGGRHDHFGDHRARRYGHRIERQGIAFMHAQGRGVDDEVETSCIGRTDSDIPAGIERLKPLHQNLRPPKRAIGDDKAADTGRQKSIGDGDSDTPCPNQQRRPAARVMPLTQQPADETFAIENAANQRAILGFAHDIGHLEQCGGPFEAVAKSGYGLLVGDGDDNPRHAFADAQPVEHPAKMIGMHLPWHQHRIQVKLAAAGIEQLRRAQMRRWIGQVHEDVRPAIDLHPRLPQPLPIH